MATGNFDPTLSKYKSEYQKKKKSLGVCKLFESFMTEKAKEVSPKTMEKYQATLSYLKRYFREEAADKINIGRAENLAFHLKEQKLSADRCKRRLRELKACWCWAIEQKLLDTENPWNNVVKRIKVSPQQKSKPFTLEEIEAIVRAFRKDKLHYLGLTQKKNLIREVQTS